MVQQFRLILSNFNETINSTDSNNEQDLDELFKNLEEELCDEEEVESPRYSPHFGRTSPSSEGITNSFVVFGTPCRIVGLSYQFYCSYDC